MNRKRLLILDDDAMICEILSHELSNEYKVTTFLEADLAYKAAIQNPPDIMIIDLFLGVVSGVDVCIRLRKNQLTRKIPILILTGQGSTENMLEAYNVGADDYIEKPINLTVIRNRLKARLARSGQYEGQSHQLGNLKLYPDRFEIEIEEKIIKLSVIEFELLRIFVNNLDKKITREEILQSTWEDLKVSERNIDVHISSMRKKLKNFDHSIKSIYGQGYILKPNVRRT